MRSKPFLSILISAVPEKECMSNTISIKLRKKHNIWDAWGKTDSEAPDIKFDVFASNDFCGSFNLVFF